jgi:hypothetical protein
MSVQLDQPKARGLQSSGFCLFLALILVGCSTHKTKPPTVFLLDASKVSDSRQRIRKGDHALDPAVEKLKHDADAVMSAGPFSIVNKQQTPPSGDKHDYMSQAPYFWPDPSKPDGKPYIRRDGERNQEIRKIPDHNTVSHMIDTVQTLSLAYYFTGDERYADRATLLLRTFFIDPATRMNPNLEFAQGIPGINNGRGIGIIETQRLVDVVDSVGLLADSKAWTAADDRALRQWFDQYLTWLLESPHGKDESSQKNNHGTHYDVQVITYALFLGKRDTATRVLREVPEKRIAVQIEPDGKQPLELARTKAWSYSIMNLRGLLQLQKLGQDAGVEFPNERLKAALDFLRPYAKGEMPWPYPQINGFRPEGANYLIRWVDRSGTYPRGDLENLTGPRLVANPADSN